MKKIAIIGPCGAGKTTLAQHLAAQLNIPLYHLDHYFWQADWQEADYDQFINKQYELVQQDQWIIDGNYTQSLSIRLFEADTVIFLDIPRWRCLYQAIKRRWKYCGTNRLDMANGCIEKFDKKFFLFLWDIWRYKTIRRPHVMQYLSILEESNSAQIYHLKSRKEIDAFKIRIKSNV